MIPGGISPLFLAPGTGEWQIIDTWSVENAGTGGSTMNFPNSLPGDMYVCLAQADTSTPSRSSSAFNEIENGFTNNTGYGIFARVATGAASSFTANGIISNYDSAIFFTVRGRTSFTSTSSVSWKGDARRNTGNSNTPSHGNLVTSYSAKSLALLAVFFDDDVIPSSSWSPPLGATLIASDSSFNNGSVAGAYQKLGAAGNYSWGDWGPLGTTSATDDDWVTGIVEITEP